MERDEQEDSPGTTHTHTHTHSVEISSNAMELVAARTKAIKNLQNSFIVTMHVARLQICLVTDTHKKGTQVKFSLFFLS